MEKSAKNEVTITPVTVKKEIVTEDIKEFAETAMNELLGWYGYENPSKEKPKILRNCRSQSESNSSGMDSPKLLPSEGCGWCGKPVEESSNCLTSAASSFCSELCFSQSRRASFKKNKTCDWCRHVRHTVSYVDFQDGASQLQFCSDKCLNQYKMHIFCRETTAHLELHPHLHNSDETSSASTLITPDLWLRNCKSPASDDVTHRDVTSRHVTVTTSSPRPSSSISPLDVQQTSPLPLVARHTKLMSAEVKRSRVKSHKKIRKRCPSTITSNSSNHHNTNNNDSPQDLRVVRHSSSPPPLDLANIANQDTRIGKHLKFPNPVLSIDHQYSKPLCEESNAFLRRPVESSTNFFDGPPHPQKAHHIIPNLDTFQRLFNTNFSPQPQIPSSPPKNLTQNNVQNNQIKSILDTLLPPPTVFMPYPVILPLPIPIPIPFPIPKIFTVREKSSELVLECKDVSSQTEDRFYSKSEANGIDEVEETEVFEKEVEDFEVKEQIKENEIKSESKVSRRLLRKRRKNTGEIGNGRMGFVKCRKMLPNQLN